jgi:ABC-type transport system involved in multi-copper enzyme maturation permease subunit
MRKIPSSIDAIRAVFKGYLPRIFQARGWLLAGLIMAPLIVVLLIQSFKGNLISARTVLHLYHNVYGQIAFPIIALLAAPACINEDLEQRTLPLMLVRPAPIWALPLGKGLLWFSWCSAWVVIAGLIMAVALIPLVGMEILTLPRKILSLVLTLWAQLGFASLLLLLFKRGTRWAALFFFIWEPLLKVFPPALQRMTFRHYLVSIAESRYDSNNAIDLLAQVQITTPLWLAVFILLAFALLAWGICGFKLMRTPIGLAGRESEG